MKTFKQDLQIVDEQAKELMILIDALGLKSQHAKNFIRAAMANALLFERKQSDYGPRNIAGFGTFGVTVRMNDKMERLKSLYNKGKRRKAVNESIQDSFRDVGNYGIIALLVENDMWPME